MLAILLAPAANYISVTNIEEDIAYMHSLQSIKLNENSSGW